MAAPFCYYRSRAWSSQCRLKLSAQCVKFNSDKLISPAGGELGGRNDRQEARVLDFMPSYPVLELVQITYTKSEATAGKLNLLSWKHCFAGFDRKFCLGEDLVSILSPCVPPLPHARRLFWKLPGLLLVPQSGCSLLCTAEKGEEFGKVQKRVTGNSSLS